MPVYLDEKKLKSESIYAIELDSEIVDSARPETTVYLLKNQLVEAAILNHNLMRVVKLLIWKLNVERASTCIKSEIIQVLQKTVSSLEDLLSKSTAKSQMMKEKIEKFNAKIAQLKQQLEVKKGAPNLLGSFHGAKPMVRRLLSKKSILKGLRGIGNDLANKNFNTLLNPMQYMSPARRISNNDLLLSHAFEFGRKNIKKDDDDCPQFKEIKEIELDNKESREPTNKQDNLGSRMNYESIDIKNTEEQAKYESELKEARNEVAWHKTLSDLLMEELIKTREQATTYKNQASEIKNSAEQAVQDENRNWQIIIKSLKV